MTPTDFMLEAVPDVSLQSIARKVLNQERISDDDCLVLFEQGSLVLWGTHNHIRERMHGDKTYFNRNFHIEPTNVCVFSKFCSYSRLYAHKEDWMGTEYRPDARHRKSYDGKPVTEVHIVGRTPENEPRLFLQRTYRQNTCTQARSAYQGLHSGGTGLYVPQGESVVCRRIEATGGCRHAIIARWRCRNIPPRIREQICADKVDADGWLSIHETKPTN